MGLSLVLVPAVAKSGMWTRYAGQCTVSSVTETDPNAGTFELVCSGSDGSPAMWEATATMAGIEGGLPSQIASGAVLQVVVVWDDWISSIRAVAVHDDADQLVLAALNGNSVDADYMTSEPQGLWSPLVVSRDGEQRCEAMTSECGSAVGRNALMFDGLAGAPALVFDHETATIDDHEIRVGDALAPVGPDNCEGASASYDFAVLRRP